MAVIPKEYLGREQALLKHTILKTYLQRLFMIIGRTEPVINYVDCFAGPWSEESPELSDTSIGISLNLMKITAQSLKETFNKKVRFRALYIEKNTVAHCKLQYHLSQVSHEAIVTDSIHGDFMDHIDNIANWTGGHFTFFFIDPKGWKKVINESTLRPLLNLDKTEFLINLMYDFFNRALTITSLNDQVEALLGQAPDLVEFENPIQRQEWILNLYRESIKRSYKGRTAYVPVKRPGVDRVLYFLIYLTRHPIGIGVFKEAAEEMQSVQRVTQAEIKLRNQVNKSLTEDMFADDSISMNPLDVTDNRLSARAYLLKKLYAKPVLVDYQCWANWLEETDLYPSDFQMAMKELLREGKVINLDADMAVVKRRTKKPIKPNWESKSERWKTI